MKIIIVILLSSIIGIANAQTKITMPVDENKKICYEGVVELPNSTKEVLFNKSKEFFYSKGASTNLQIINGEVDKIYFNGAYPAKRNRMKGKENLNYVIKLFVKDNKIKYQMTDFVFYGQTSSYASATTYFMNGVAFTNINSGGGKVYHYALDKFNTPKYLNKNHSMFIEIDRINKIIISDLIKFLKDDKTEKGF